MHRKATKKESNTRGRKEGVRRDSRYRGRVPLAAARRLVSELLQFRAKLDLLPPPPAPQAARLPNAITSTNVLSIPASYATATEYSSGQNCELKCHLSRLLALAQ